MNCRRNLALLCSLAAAAAGWARPPESVCGAHAASADEAAYRHRQSLRQRAPSLAAVGAGRPAPAAGYDAGDVAVLGAAGGAVARRNLFDLGSTSLIIEPDATGGYRLRGYAETYDDSLASDGTPATGLGDDDAVAVELRFAFPFYGQTYNRVFVNSDGNLTFQEAESSSTARSLGRLAAGPPRIAPFLTDLDPTAPGGGVRILSRGDILAVSWENVAEFGSITTRNSFQVRLYPGGRVDFTWRRADTRDAVVGLSPGRLRGQTDVIHLSAAPDTPFPATVAEVFTGRDQLDAVRIAQLFYTAHEDAYDYLVIYNTLGLFPGVSALASEYTVRGNVAGIGTRPADTGAVHGSARRLQSVLDMGPLSQYPLDPLAPVGLRGRITGDTALTILGHETGHLFLATASVRDPADPAKRPMLGAQGVHWSFNFNSEASLVEGNRIRDDGASATPRFMTTGTVEGYAPLDQYLMGFRAPWEVPPLFLVEGGTENASRLPQIGVSLTGQRRDISVEELIAVEGARRPDDAVAQRRFRFAFILLTDNPELVSPNYLEQVERYRREFEPYFRRVTESRAAADATLRRAVHLSAYPALELRGGEQAEIRVELETAPAADLPLRVSAPAGCWQSPAEITIPAGARAASFPLQPTAACAAELAVENDGVEYMSAYARVRVASAR